MDTLRNEYQYGKEGKFSDEAYLRESNVERRYQMAESYFKQAENAWIATYTIVANSLDHRGEKKNLIVGEMLDQSKRRQQETGGNGYTEQDGRKKVEVYAEPVKALIKIQTLSLLFAAFKETMPPETLEEIFETAWKTFLQEFGIPENTSAVTQEVLAWLKEKIQKDEVLVLTLARAQNETEAQEIEKLLKQYAAPFALGGTSRLQPGKGDTLVILPDLIQPQESGIDFIGCLAHERGHEIRNAQLPTEQKTQRDEAKQVIFSEFFAFLEEWRTYASLTAAETEQLKNKSRAQLFIIEKSLHQHEIATTLPDLLDEITVDLTSALTTLHMAFQHGLESHQAFSRLQEYKELTAQGLDEATILEKLKNIKLLAQPLVDLEKLRWLLRKKE